MFGAGNRVGLLRAIGVPDVECALHTQSGLGKQIAKTVNTQRVDGLSLSSNNTITALYSDDRD